MIGGQSRGLRGAGLSQRFLLLRLKTGDIGLH